MKRIVIIILTVLFCVGLGGAAFALAKRFEKTPPATEQPNDSKNDSSTELPDIGGGSLSGGEGTATDVLKIPANADELYQDGLTMQKGASLYLGDGERPSLRFTCFVSPELKAEVEADSTKTFAMLAIPTKFFNLVNTENYTCIDWVKAFDEAGIDTYYLTEYTSEQITEIGDEYCYRYRLTDIPAAGVNMDVTAMGVVIKANADGTKSYTYARMPEGETYKSNARTVAYVACAALSANALGYDSYSDEHIALIEGFLNEAVDLANGLETPTDDNSKFDYTVNKTQVELAVGETFQIETKVEGGVRVPVFYESASPDIVTVDSNGLLTGISANETTIKVYVANVLTEITVKVS